MFFVNTDYTKDIQKAKIYLAKPNKTVISHIHEKQGANLSIKLGNIYELSFSIPHFIDGEHIIEKNPHTESIREKMLLMVKLSGMTEWFIIDSIEEDVSDSDVFNVTAFSLGYELSHKRIGSYNGEGKSCRAMANEILESSSWNVGNIDAEIQYRTINLTTPENESKRTLEISDSNALDAIIQLSEAFGAVPIFNSENKTISFKDLKNIGTFKGLTINYGKLLSSINRSRTTDELVTRMYAFGYDDLTIAGVNPTGQMYIEDFSFFLFPFERDANKNVIKSSYFMSDALCHAILNHQELVQIYSPEINSLMDDILDEQSLLQTEKTRLLQLQLELQSIQYRLDTAKALEDNDLIGQIQLEEINKKAEINAQESLLRGVEANLTQNENRISILRNRISNDAGFTNALYDELNYYVIEKEWRDDRYIDAQELYNDALERFAMLREPKVVISVDIDNLFEIMDEQYYWNKLELGDLIKIKYPQMNIEYMAQIIEINFDFDGGTISITIANTEKTGNDMDRIKELLSKSQTASTLLDNNKYKWDKVVQVEDEVYRLLNSEWDANKRKIIAGVNNLIEVGNRGIIITSPDNPNDIVIMQSGIIALSKDGGDTWKTAIKPDGIVAERLVGNVIAGRNLIITNGNGSFTVDEDGVRIVGTSLEIVGGLSASQLDQNLRDFINLTNAQITENNEAIDNLNSDLSDMFSDSYVTSIEALSLSLSLKRVMSESQDVINIATSLEINTEKTSYQSVLNSLNVLLTNRYINKSNYPIAITSQDRIEIENKFKDVENAKMILINAITAKREQNAIDYTDAIRDEIEGELQDIIDIINDFDSYIEDGFMDGVIEISEAKAIEKYINTLNKEKSELEVKITFINETLEDTTLKGVLDTRKTSYDSAHSNLISAINSAIIDGKTTTAEKNLVDSSFTTYRSALSQLSRALEECVKGIAEQEASIAERNAKAYTDALLVGIREDFEDVSDMLDNLDDYIGDSFRDGIIEESESKSISIYINSLNTEKADLDSRYSQIYNNATLIDNTIKSNLNSAKTTYNTAHNNLILSINTAIADGKTTPTEKENVDTEFATYKDALATLSTRLEEAINAITIERARIAEQNAKDASVGKGVVLNGVKIDASNGITVTTSDSKNRVYLNATKGFTIQKNNGTSASPSYSDVFYVDTNGNVQMKNGVISWGDVNAPTASQTGALPLNSSMLTYITNNGIYTGTITTNQLVAGSAKISTAMIVDLVVGNNVTMGANASISWNNITQKPTASDIGAMPISTYIDANGVFTGRVKANNIQAGTISGVDISGATITGGSISVTTELKVGNIIRLGSMATDYQLKSIYFNGQANITGGTGFVGQGIEINCDELDLTGVTEVLWGHNKPTAVFG